ncbi:hypothetical protein PHK61_17725 [Actinomycetospora lutea]|uniref:hypothetical protein n=1 Tax=Actinomycetospora lutea TaxID=663604 RepID=UPI0023661EBE|nr:hypothetical protein [Actinomycetospora lutea]MDD7940267.1 hypothetical protein [Actinomycetospora lutea]
MRRLPAHHAARATGALLAAQGVFQACLASGAPWGRVAYGGTHPGRLPEKLRRISGVAAPVYAASALAVATGAGPPRVRRAALSGLAAFMAVGTVLNGVSRSPGERLVWTPFCAVTAVLAWAARPDQGTRATSVITGGR